MAASSIDRVFGFRTDLASRAAALSFTSNLTLMVMKFVVAVMSGSIAVLSDAIDSAEDVLASLFAFISIQLASRPADEEHPYGHGKAESLAAAAQALLIAGGACYIIARAVQRLSEHHVQIDTTPGLIALSVTAAVNVGVVLYVGRAARLTGSVALKADTRHLWTNVVQASGVILALTLVAITGRSIFDPIMALLLAVFLIWTAGNIFVEALEEIMDVRLPKRELEVIEACLREHKSESVRGYHGLRTRKAGRQRYVDIHLMVDRSQTVGEAHVISETIVEAIRSKLLGAVVTIHVDPDDGDEGPIHSEPVEVGGENGDTQSAD
jgi:cation diffusion facilitator family transporter